MPLHNPRPRLDDFLNLPAMATATVTATTPTPTAEHSATYSNFTLASAYTKSKDLYAEYCPKVAATLIASVLTKALLLSPIADSPKSPESLDALVASLVAVADEHLEEVHSTGLRPVLTAQYINAREFVEGKVTEAKSATTAKVAEIRSTVHTNIDCTKTQATCKYGEVKAAVAKKVEQTKTIAQKVEIVAADKCSVIKSEIEQKGLVAVAKCASCIAREQVVSAIEVAKSDGIPALFKTMTIAVAEVLNEATVVSEEAEPTDVATPAAAVSATAPAAAGVEAPAPVPVEAQVVPEVANTAE
mmetsp:Transcript_36072/g.62370  ORF Transcript_36072/g.62370 Transcript_36072/m.62370 type:complete len:302 (+) Transcript_36072:153-1058(+)